MTMRIDEKLLKKAIKTNGESYDTQLRVQGLEVWGTPPNRYRYETTFYLQSPQGFPFVARKQDKPDDADTGEYRYDFGFYDNNNKFIARFIYLKEEEIPYFLEKHEGQLGYPTCQVRVFYTKTGKRDGSFCSKSEGLPVAAVWYDERVTSKMFDIELSPQEAQMLLDFDDAVQDAWRESAKDWIEQENARTMAIAHAVASEALPAIAYETECLECGAIFDEIGHVHAGGMGCDRCD